MHFGVGPPIQEHRENQNGNEYNQGDAQKRFRRIGWGGASTPTVPGCVRGTIAADVANPAMNVPPRLSTHRGRHPVAFTPRKIDRNWERG